MSKQTDEQTETLAQTLAHIYAVKTFKTAPESTLAGHWDNLTDWEQCAWRAVASAAEKAAENHQREDRIINVDLGTVEDRCACERLNQTPKSPKKDKGR